jgi:hypothetical protein
MSKDATSEALRANHLLRRPKTGHNSLSNSIRRSVVIDSLIPSEQRDDRALGEKTRPSFNLYQCSQEQTPSCCPQI